MKETADELITRQQSEVEEYARCCPTKVSLWPDPFEMFGIRVIPMESVEPNTAYMVTDEAMKAGASGEKPPKNSFVIVRNIKPV